jgi:spore coat polysaccharide biosynthesis protein SpsF
MRQRNVAIIQARMGSCRFPGKMLARLGCLPLLEWVARRLFRATSLAQIVLATSEDEGDDALAELATTLGMIVFRGSESDVLGRFVGAATMSRADNVVRICADNPFVDPVEIDRLVTYFSDYPCDYACNHQDRLGSGYADGFGAEILPLSLLRQLASLAVEQRYREHVTLYLWEHQTAYCIRSVPAPSALMHPTKRFDVDRPEDLIKLNRLVEAGVTVDTAAAQIVQLSTAIGG